MKKLILIQNDYPGTGKSTLALCFHRYLQQYGVSHQLLSLTEEDIAAPGLHPARRQHADAEQVLRSCRCLAR
jgi:DNA polymerase III delta prime subunit